MEPSTLTYLSALTDADLAHVVQDSPTESFAVDGLLWHVMIHEMRHTAQIAVLLRMQDIKSPSLDYCFTYRTSTRKASDESQLKPR